MKLGELMSISRQIFQRDKNKTRNVLEFHTECLCNGRWHMKYGFVRKVIVDGGWGLGLAD